MFEKIYLNYIKLIKYVSEFFNYISRNLAMIVDYGKRWREGKRISSAFIESLVNSLLNKRFCKKQQMQWKKQNAHLLLQVRVNVINKELGTRFKKWYPDFNIGDNDNIAPGESEKPCLKLVQNPAILRQNTNPHKMTNKEEFQLKQAV